MTSKTSKSDQIKAHPSWTEQEEWVWEKLCAGEIADFNKTEGYGGELDPKKPEGWIESRILSAKFIETILLEDLYRGALKHHGVNIIGAWFKEPLDLSNANLCHQLSLVSTRFDADVNLSSLKTPYLINLMSSKFGGKLDMDGVRIDSHCFMSNGSEFLDAVFLRDAKIGGQLTLTNSIFRVKLDMDCLEITDNLFMGDGAEFFDVVILTSVKVGGILSMQGSKFHRKLNMGSIKVASSLHMRNGAEFSEEVILVGAKVGGTLEMDGSKFRGKLNMDNIEVARSLFMRYGAEFFDEVILRGAKINGQVSMIGSKIKSKLNMSTLMVDGSLYMGNEDEGSDFSGEVFLVGANIKGQLGMARSKFRGMLDMESIRVGESLFLMDSIVDNLINMIFSEIGANLFIAGSRIENLDLTGSKIKGEFCLGSGKFPPAQWKKGAKLVLRNTEVGALQDLPTSWPDMIEMDGFKYSYLGGFAAGEVHSMANREISWMKEWLERQQNYSPQPYEQLGKVLKEAGYKGKANEILYAGRERERSVSKKWSWWWLSVEKFTIGYGYRLRNLLCWFLVLIAGGMWVLKLQGQGLVHNMPFGFSYTLDMLLPLIRLNEVHYTIKLIGFAKYYFYFLKIAGYFLVSLLIYGILEIVRKSR
jgi:hypothetical protein